jgi:hypothetical protein
MLALTLEKTIGILTHDSKTEPILYTNYLLIDFTGQLMRSKASYNQGHLTWRILDVTSKTFYVITRCLRALRETLHC